ncbi:MAG: T9SS type A sorting domain-containing protein, partial [Ignavibacteria bacterium]|nr:T9SS type A sorting domain-containing protein [Ignavibacteria bacterium]
ISFTIPEAMARQNVSLKIYSINGELIKTFFEKELPAGNYVTRWDGMNETGTAVPSGVYLYKLTAGSSFVTGKMSLVK